MYYISSPKKDARACKPIGGHLRRWFLKRSDSTGCRIHEHYVGKHRWGLDGFGADALRKLRMKDTMTAPVLHISGYHYISYTSECATVRLLIKPPPGYVLDC